MQTNIETVDRPYGAFVFEGAPPNGRRCRDEKMHLRTFGADGKVAGWRHCLDTAKHIAAAG